MRRQPDQLYRPEVWPPGRQDTVRGAIGLCRKELQPAPLRLPAVDQVLIVDPLPVLWVLGLRTVIADCAEEECKRGQSLLPVDNQELHHPGRTISRTRRKHQRTDEVCQIRVSGTILG